MLTPSLSVHDRARLLVIAEGAARALARLDGAVSRSPVREAWSVRAQLHAEARVGGLDGVRLSPADYFRGLVGLLETERWRHVDWRRLSVSVALTRDLRQATSLASEPVDRLAVRLGFILGSQDLPECEPVIAAARELAACLAVHRPASLVDAGLVLHDVLRRPLRGLEPGPGLAEIDWLGLRSPWSGWLLAPAIADWLVSCGLVETPLPCLVPVRLSMRFATATPTEVVAAFLGELAEQANAGYALLRRLEGCLSVWRARLPALSARSRVHGAAALFLVLPALRRGQVARALEITPVGAGKVLAALEAAEIVRVEQLSERNRFYVADESMADFKVRPRQGRHRRPPSPAALGSAFAELEAALSALDDLVGEPGTASEDDAVAARLAQSGE